MICFACQKEIVLLNNKASFREECPHCRADVHVCKNCEFYDAKAYNECHEPSAERVREKDRANLCDFFTPRKGGAESPQAKSDQFRAAAEALFKKKN